MDSHCSSHSRRYSSTSSYLQSLVVGIVVNFPAGVAVWAVSKLAARAHKDEASLKLGNRLELPGRVAGDGRIVARD